MRVILNDTLEKKGISQYKLAKLTGITPSNINKLCNNRTTSIQFNILERICNALECTPNDVLVPENTKTQPFYSHIE